MGKIYHLSVDQPNGPMVADAHGDLDAMAYHVRRLKDVLETTEGHEYTATIAEVTEVLGESKRTVANVSADAEVVLYVLTKRLRAERAATAQDQ